MSALADAGIAYLRAGLRIIALAGKTPNGAIHPRWSLSNCFQAGDEAKWVQACTHPETTGVGILLTGHLCVVDVDGEEGAVSLQRLTDTEPLVTAATATARGLHLWFISPFEVPSMKLAEKLDVKGLGGYVAAPPSVHPGDAAKGVAPGHVYSWLSPLINDHGVAEAEWLPTPIEEIVELRQRVVRVDRRAIEGGSMDGLVAHLRRQVEGNRNGCLYWAANCAREDGFSVTEAIAELGPASGLPAREARRTIQSAYR